MSLFIKVVMVNLVSAFLNLFFVIYSNSPYKILNDTAFLMAIGSLVFVIIRNRTHPI